MRIQPNATDQSVYFFVIDADGAPASATTINAGLAAGTAAYQAGPTAAIVNDTLTALAATTTAHTDWYARAIADGIVRVDYPDAPWATGAANVRTWLDFSGIDADYVVAGGFVDVQLGYALQQPDTSTTAIFRAAAGTTLQAAVDTKASQSSVTDIGNVAFSIVEDTGTTLPATLATIDTNVDTAVMGLISLTSSMSSVIATVNSGAFGLEVTKAAVDAVAVDTGTTIPAAIEEVGGSGTVTAEDIADKRTWKFPKSGSSIISTNTVPLAASQAGTATVCFDLNGVLESNVTVASVSTPTVTGTAATIGTPVIHTSKRKVNIPLTSVTATAGRYTVSMTFVATDSEQYVVKGYLQVE
jgi:hypothetical protein